MAERAAGYGLNPPKAKGARPACPCLLGNDIGAYNSCAHFCKYCYANYDKDAVKANMKKHDPGSPFLIGNSMPLDRVTIADQKSYITDQLEMKL